MDMKDIIKIVETEEGLREVLKQYKVKNIKSIAEHVMSFILDSSICSPKIKKAYAKEINRAKKKREKNNE